MSSPVSTGMGTVRLVYHLGVYSANQVNSASHPSWVYKSSTSFNWLG